MGKKLVYSVFQHDLVFALLWGLRRIHIFCSHANAGVTVGPDDLILFLAHQ